MMETFNATNNVKENESPQEFVKRTMIEDLSVIIDMINTFIPANDEDKKQLLIGESMLSQLMESLNNANTNAELSKILDIHAIREDWSTLPDQLSDTNIRIAVNDWKKKILDKFESGD